jgi:hypothetical protein
MSSKRWSIEKKMENVFKRERKGKKKEKKEKEKLQESPQIK